MISIASVQEKLHPLRHLRLRLRLMRDAPARRDRRLDEFMGKFSSSTTEDQEEEPAGTIAAAPPPSLALVRGQQYLQPGAFAVPTLAGMPSLKSSVKRLLAQYEEVIKLQGRCNPALLISSVKLTTKKPAG
jgi:hypothetical protein